MLFTALCLVTGAQAANAAPPSIQDLLGALRATGTEVLYSSELVPPGLLVAAPLRAADPLSRVIEALAPHGLMLRETSSGHYVVTRATAPDAIPASVTAVPVGSPAAPLAPVTVFASRYTYPEASTGEPVALAQADIAKTPGASEDALRALRTTPGLATNISSKPYVRGAFLEDVLVRFDGVTLTNPFHFRNFQNLISAFDPNAINAMHVYTGGFPVDFGTRSAAVIDLSSRQIAAGAEFQVGGSRETLELATAGHAEHLPLEWLFTLRHSADGDQLRPVDATFGSPSFYDAAGHLRWQTTAAGVWTLGWLLIDDQIHVGGEPSEEQSHAEFRDLNAWLAWDLDPSDAVRGHTSLATSTEHQERSGTLNLPGIATGRLADQRFVNSLALRSDWRITPSPAATVRIGAELGEQDAELAFSRNEMFAGPIRSSFGLPAAVAIASNPGPRALTQGAYVAWNWHQRGLELELGGRIDRQAYQGFSSHVQGSPRLNVRYDPAPRWHLYGSWGEFIQAQRPGEWRTEESQAAPDPASRATHLIGGAGFDGANSLRWRLEGYRNHWTSISPYFDSSLNSASLVPELAPDRVRLAPTDAETAGVELTVRRPFGANLEAWSTYVISRTTDDLRAMDVPRSWDQRHAANLGLSWRHARTAASMVIGWHSGWPRTPLMLVPGTPGVLPAILPGTRNSARWGDYFSADLRLAQVVPLSHGNLSVWLEATNLTNHSNDCCAQFGATDQTGAQPQLQTLHWQPRKINLGFTWKLTRQ